MSNGSKYAGKKKKEREKERNNRELGEVESLQF